MPSTQERQFNPETIKVMQTALDEAWRSLRPEQQANTSRTTLAVFILEAAAAGERDPIRLRTRALTKAATLDVA